MAFTKVGSRDRNTSRCRGAVNLRDPNENRVDFFRALTQAPQQREGWGAPELSNQLVSGVDTCREMIPAQDTGLESRLA